MRLGWGGEGVLPSTPAPSLPSGVRVHLKQSSGGVPVPEGAGVLVPHAGALQALCTVLQVCMRVDTDVFDCKLAI